MFQVWQIKKTENELVSVLLVDDKTITVFPKF